MRLLPCVLSAATLLALTAPRAGATVIVDLGSGGSLRGYVDFTLVPPDGALAGPAGQTLGWGLTIDNESNGWVVITSTTYDQSTSIGTFADLLTPQFLAFAVGPNAPNNPWTQAFDPSVSQGLGSYVIDGSFALPGDMAVGNLDLLFDVHSIDPNDPNYLSGNDTQLNGLQALLPASVTDVPAPEPATLALTGLALLGLRLKAARRRS